MVPPRERSYEPALNQVLPFYQPHSPVSFLVPQAGIHNLHKRIEDLVRENGRLRVMNEYLREVHVAFLDFHYRNVSTFARSQRALQDLSRKITDLDQTFSKQWGSERNSGD